MIQLKSTREIELMAEGGRILAATVQMLRREVKAGMSTLDLDAIAESFIRSHAGAKPAFKGLYGFPGTLCTSINHEIVHGIPSKKRVLVDGDIVSLDFGVKYQGYYTDSAMTVAVGEIPEESRRLLDVTREALDAGIAAAAVGNHIGDIGHAVQTVAEGAGFSVVREYVGHAIGTAMHERPEVPNYGLPGKGPKLRVGNVFAVEPMVNVGGPETVLLDDGWSVITADGQLSAHVEHTIAILDDGPEVLTLA